MLKVDNTTKTYRKNSHVIHAADGLTLEVNAGDFVVIHGPSGSGKSTLLLMIGGKRIILADEPTGNLDARNTEIVMSCLQDAAQKGCLVMMVTHNQSLLELGTQRLHLNNGGIVA